MVSFTGSFFSTIIVAAVLSVTVEAAPWPLHARHSTHHTRYIGKRSLKVESYHPKSTFKTFGDDGVTIPSGNSLVASANPLKDSAFAYVNSLGISSDNVAWRSGFEAGANRVAYLKQSINGIPLANAVANVAFNGDTVVSYGSSFVDTKAAKIAPASPTVSWRSVLPQVEEVLEGKYNGFNTTLEYLARADGSVALTHVVQIQNEETNAWYEAYIDAHSGELLSVTDFVNDASYTALPLTKVSFEDGVENIRDPEDPEASPFGWHSIGNGNSSTTSGNNVLAFKDQRVSVQTSAGLNFNAVYDDNKQPIDPTNVNAARTNAFFVANAVHDFAYRYGFTEAAFNFQLSNFNKGGRQNDRVLISVQDASGTNNANFATPPDGQSGICRMFIWNLTPPVNRDGSLENDIIIHELTHGITNRMTGGGTGRCLQTLESGGLGEGWGDAMANWMAQKSAQTTNFAVGAYVTGDARGIRSAPYSTSKATNPLTYASLRNLNQVHEIGEVWANMLHNVYAALVAEKGFSADKLTNPDGPEGNIVFMRLFMDALSLQPCNPTFIEARDAWLQADQNRFGGANKCTVARAFASRGLGIRASSAFTDDATLPDGC
ncbi:Extracellular metalloproteinase MEP [Psilocybe cubensis]|uniref:Extracellular metalloproteinase n=2 Tax=Psilocybe cubensis TaxID=181762 RepID=A0A8H7XJZ3_PSICU|nr:Extracellular metalloproteinase MEP [Psilocybe cubensis]KAH9477316.1 Extracellular metalloproteinase MEP [Psilocybe cubensis]